MEANEILQDLRDCMFKTQDREAAQLFFRLDEWMCKGGRTPKQWQAFFNCSSCEDIKSSARAERRMLVHLIDTAIRLLRVAAEHRAADFLMQEVLPFRNVKV